MFADTLSSYLVLINGIRSGDIILERDTHDSQAVHAWKRTERGTYADEGILPYRMYAQLQREHFHAAYAFQNQVSKEA